VSNEKANASRDHARDAPLILLVDDAESARLVGVRRLGSAGYRVLAVANELAALEVLLRTHVACVVADWDLGLHGGNGLNLLVKAGKRRPGIGRVLWCGAEAGCDLADELEIRCVPKGGPWSELLDAIAAELAGYRWGTP
jgi:CheY-like chemotaxis protein